MQQDSDETPLIWRSAIKRRTAMRLQLFAPERDRDFFVVATQNYLAVFNSLDRDLINLSAELKAEDLTFRHGLAIDDRKASCAFDSDAGDEERPWRNLALVGSA